MEEAANVGDIVATTKKSPAGKEVEGLFVDATKDIFYAGKKIPKILPKRTNDTGSEAAAFKKYRDAAAQAVNITRLLGMEPGLHGLNNSALRMPCRFCLPP